MLALCLLFTSFQVATGSLARFRRPVGLRKLSLCSPGLEQFDGFKWLPLLPLLILNLSHVGLTGASSRWILSPWDVTPNLGSIFAFC